MCRSIRFALSLVCLLTADRALWAKERGYQVKMASLWPLECSPKNNVLIGSPSEALGLMPSLLFEGAKLKDGACTGNERKYDGDIDSYYGVTTKSGRDDEGNGRGDGEEWQQREEEGERKREKVEEGRGEEGGERGRGEDEEKERQEGEDSGKFEGRREVSAEREKEGTYKSLDEAKEGGEEKEGMRPKERRRKHIHSSAQLEERLPNYYQTASKEGYRVGLNDKVNKEVITRFNRLGLPVPCLEIVPSPATHFRLVCRFEYRHEQGYVMWEVRNRFYSFFYYCFFFFFLPCPFPCPLLPFFPPSFSLSLSLSLCV